MDCRTTEFSADSSEGDDGPVSNPSRLMHYENQLQFDPNFDAGALSDWTADEARAVFQILLDWSYLGSWSDFPLPCRGLPGFLHTEHDQTDEAGELIAIGLGYLRAVVFNERRGMHLRWKEAREMIHKLRREGRDKAWDEHVARQVEREQQQIAAAAATPQLVYFIGAASGPIKIGIAANPKSRLQGLQTGHHEKLELLATCDGGQSQERAYHKLFADRRMNGEWFERCPEILAEVERLNAEP